MSQNLFFGFPIPVALAFAALVVLLLAVARLLAAMRRPIPVTPPHAPRRDRGEAGQLDDETMFRLGRHGRVPDPGDPELSQEAVCRY